MENLKLIFTKHKKIILTSLFCVILCVATIIFICKKNLTNYSLPESTLFNKISASAKINSLADDFNKINNSFKDCINDLTINVTSSSEVLQENITKMDKLKSEVSGLNIENNDKPDLIPLFVSSIESTQNLYNYCNTLLSSENNMLENDFSSQLASLQSTCMDNYKKISSLGINLYFSDDTLDFFSKLYGYLNNYSKASKQSSVKVIQNKEFMTYYSTALNDLSSILQDLQPAILKIREDNRSLDVLLEDVDTKETKFLEIKKNFNYASIPEECLSYSNVVNDIFSLYSTYLNSMRTAIIYEKSSSGYEENKKNIDKTYDNAFSKFNDVKTALNTALKSLTKN